MNFPIHIDRTSLFQILGELGGTSHGINVALVVFHLERYNIGYRSKI